jgi:3-dehydroquinate synthase
MNTLYVELGDRRYPIYIGHDLLAQHDLFHPWIWSQQIMIVTNTTVAPLYLDPLKRALGNYDTPSVILPDGEQYKTLEAIGEIMTALLEHRFERSCTLIALGGGVIGDITGFAAACYQRGVNYIQVPTTLLAQVDSSVGGKTAVNHPLGKNMIGAFHQPRCVIADTATLTTLDDRQLHAGFSEVIKYGLIRDAEFFRWLEEHLSDLLAREPKALAYAIEQSCQNKAEVVARDERESGLRATLNLGHTFGHAIEAGLGYGRWLHGEAVAAGIGMAADLSARLGWLDRDPLARIGSLLHRAHLPIRSPAELTVDRMLELMAVDKKAKDGKVRLVLLEAIGQAVVTSDYDHAALQSTLALCRSMPAVA